ncbi:MAG: hypoxanthine phosphoribosyltransferase [Corallococcus sp.]|nr:hypoxanthine phosphoribosyltransferase [Corallococcus sp.]
MKNNEDIKQVLFTSEQIQRRAEELARQITEDYRKKNLLIVGVLKGAWIFVADLLRKIDLNVDVDFVCASSYGGRTTTSGMVALLKDVYLDCVGRDVLLVEDIVDTGITLSYIKRRLLARKANSVSIAALLSKPSRRKVDVDIKYLGYEIPDVFVVGYGMDYAEKYRTLQDICVLKEEIYNK